jgi:hypothetical protein
MDAAYDPAAWRDFGVALVSASAALLGLVFVVVSIHLRAVGDDPVLRRRAEIMLGLLATTFAASAVLVIPGQGREALGIELMPIALVYLHNPVDAGDHPLRAQRDARDLDALRRPRARAAGRLSAMPRRNG